MQKDTTIPPPADTPADSFLEAIDEIKAQRALAFSRDGRKLGILPELPQKTNP